MSNKYNKNIRTIRRHFDNLDINKNDGEPYSYPVSLVFDGTFFGRGYGLMIYRANCKNIYWREIDNEKIAYISEDLCHLQAVGWQFSSFTIDGRKGIKQLLEKLFPNVPIQMCIFHQKKVVQRCITNNPKTDCGKEIKELMSLITFFSEEEFSRKLQDIKDKYKYFLLERNENKRFVHRELRRAIRSLSDNKSYLFSCKKYPELSIPNTTNSCDGSFAHWKSKVKIHRGLRKNRRIKMINFLLGLQQK